MSSTDPIPIPLKAKYTTRRGGKSLKITKAGNGKRASKGLSGSFTHVPPGMGLGEKVARKR